VGCGRSYIPQQIHQDRIPLLWGHASDVLDGETHEVGAWFAAYEEGGFGDVDELLSSVSHHHSTIRHQPSLIYA
jgi:hypothetical protein